MIKSLRDFCRIVLYRSSLENCFLNRFWTFESAKIDEDDDDYDDDNNEDDNDDYDVFFFF